MTRKRRYLDHRGFTLIEMVMAGGLLAGAMMVTNSVISNSFQQFNKMRVVLEFYQEYSKLKIKSVDPNRCARVFMLGTNLEPHILNTEVDSENEAELHDDDLAERHRGDFKKSLFANKGKHLGWRIKVNRVGIIPKGLIHNPNYLGHRRLKAHLKVELEDEDHILPRSYFEKVEQPLEIEIEYNDASAGKEMVYCTAASKTYQSGSAMKVFTIDNMKDPQLCQKFRELGEPAITTASDSRAQDLFIPSDINSITVELWGGGGAGGSGGLNSDWGTSVNVGGASGAYMLQVLNVSANKICKVAVGCGGGRDLGPPDGTHSFVHCGITVPGTAPREFDAIAHGGFGGMDLMAASALGVDPGGGAPAGYLQPGEIYAVGQGGVTGTESTSGGMGGVLTQMGANVGSIPVPGGVPASGSLEDLKAADAQPSILVSGGAGGNSNYYVPMPVLDSYGGKGGRGGDGLVIVYWSKE